MSGFMDKGAAALRCINPRQLAAKNLLDKKYPGMAATIPNSKLNNDDHAAFPASPTDLMMSPCSKKLWTKRSFSPVPGEEKKDMFGLSQFEETPMPDLGNTKLVFGSSSKSRKLVLDQIKWKYTQMSPDIDEKAIRLENPMELPLLIAKGKADALMQRLADTDAEPCYLLTADQIVLYKQHIREKPINEVEAKEFLASYSNDFVSTVGAVVVTHYPSGTQVSGVDVATIFWSYIPEETITKVVRKGHVFDAAGGFCIEDEDLNPLVRGVDGTVDSIMGMPVAMTVRLLNELHERVCYPEKALHRSNSGRSSGRFSSPPSRKNSSARSSFQFDRDGMALSTSHNASSTALGEDELVSCRVNSSPSQYLQNSATVTATPSPIPEAEEGDVAGGKSTNSDSSEELMFGQISLN